MYNLGRAEQIVWEREPRKFGSRMPGVIYGSTGFLRQMQTRPEPGRRCGCGEPLWGAVVGPAVMAGCLCVLSRSHPEDVLCLKANRCGVTIHLEGFRSPNDLLL